MSDITYFVTVTLTISVSANSDESAHAGAVDKIRDLFARDGYAIADIPDVDTEIVGTM